MNNEFTATHRHNLYRLAKHLFALPDDYENFGMNCYAWDQTLRREIGPGTVSKKSIPECDAVACAAGHAAEIPIFKPLAEEFYFYIEFSQRLFNCFASEAGLGNFMFGQNWNLIDDTAEGAAQRITMALLNACSIDAVLSEISEKLDDDAHHEELGLDHPIVYSQYTEARLDAWYEGFREIQLEHILDDLAESDSLNCGGPNTHEYAELSETRFDRAADIWEARV